MVKSDRNELILLLLKGKATREEEETVRLWLEESEENRELYRQISEVYYRLNYSKQWEKIDGERAVKQLVVRRRVKRWTYAFTGIAALLVLCLGIFRLMQDKGKANVPLVAVNDAGTSGERKAMLTLPNGEKVELTAGTKVNVDLGFAQAVEDSVKGLVYQFNDSVQPPHEYHTLSVPRAGEYIIVLSDGSRVWLNSDTELKYPVTFDAHKREVYLTGEAYFEVAKDPQRPFVVVTPQTSTTVLGTSFNVMAYKDEACTEITLVTGSVLVKAGDHDCRISPGYQLSVDNKSLKMEQQQVNIDQYISWKAGIFVFDGMTLGELAVKLSRWYDVDFFFANRETAEKRFTGAIKRNKSLQFMLDFIQKTSGVRMETKGRVITVYESP